MRRPKKASPSARTKRRSLEYFINRRSPRAKAARSAAEARGGATGAGYKLADPESITRVALEVLRTHRGVVDTQGELWRLVSGRLGKEEPPLRTSPERMRALLAVAQGLQLEVRYARRESSRPLVLCPVCFHPVKSRLNATLWGDSVIVGYRCTACPFWTPIKRRVPAQYTFRVGPSGA